jgi:hypothetical protein
MCGNGSYGPEIGNSSRDIIIHSGSDASDSYKSLHNTDTLGRGSATSFCAVLRGLRSEMRERMQEGEDRGGAAGTAAKTNEAAATRHAG